MIEATTMRFLTALKKNNNKEWFDNNRSKYVAAKANFDEFVCLLLEQLSQIDQDVAGLSAKECTFRINRDIRFSKNKTPYKVNLSAFFCKGGKKSVNAGYYFHLQPGDNNFIGGGLWMPQANELKKVRQEIDYCFPEFLKTIKAAPFRKHFKELESDEKQMLVNLPRGYDKDNPAGHFLRMKSFIASKNLSDGEVLSGALVRESLETFKALAPFVKFINRTLE